MTAAALGSRAMIDLNPEKFRYIKETNSVMISQTQEKWKLILLIFYL
jgi:hypothetical protein